MTLQTDSLRDSIRATLGDAYLIERELDGGMSRVFIAQDRTLERRVVVKVLHPELAASVSLERFRREILLVAGLQHPHIVSVLSAGTVEELPYFVMPYVDGQSLAERLRRGPLSVRETVAIVKDVARALAFAHKRGIVHRDIKPANILLAGGSAMVTDFGVAKALTSARRTGPTATRNWGLTTAGSSLGTLLYMAPEQAAADPEIDGRADIYALGITAFEMLTGSPPFAHLSARAMLAARMSADAPSVATRRTDIPAPLDTLLRRCLAADPADRPRTAQDVVDELDSPDIVSGEFARLQPARTRRRMRAGQLAVAAAFLAVLGGVGVVASRSHSPQHERAAIATAPVPMRREVAVVPFVDLSSSTSDAHLATGITDAVASNLAKSTHIAVVSPSASAALAQRIRSGNVVAGHVGADLLLEGTVQRENGRVRVTARLSNASDGVMRWADVYDRDSRDTFAVTDEIARAIVASISHPTDHSNI